MRLPRLRLRTLMSIVAAFGLALGLVMEAGKLTRRSRELSRRADEYGIKAQHERDMAGYRSAPEANETGHRGNPGHDLVRAAYFDNLRDQYAYASAHPWLPVPPDPPEPE